MSAADCPHWVMLEPVVLRRDSDRFFPDEIEAPIRASATTSWGASFRIAFSLAKPPLISRLYAQLPGFPGPSKERPIGIVATHRHLVLFRVSSKMPGYLVQDFFIFDSFGKVQPSTSLLKTLPPCTEPDMDYRRRDGSLPRHRGKPFGKLFERRLQMVRSMGLLCRQGEDQYEFAVVELDLYKHSQSKIFADIFLFRSSTDKWESMRLPVIHSNNSDDSLQLILWQTDTVIPVGSRWLCWVDYYRGILFCDVFNHPNPTVTFLRLPLDKFPDTPIRSVASSWLYRGLSAIDGGCKLKFVDVARDDGIGYGALSKPGAGFTITCHTLMVHACEWNKDDITTVTSDELWTDDYRLPRETLMFPQVNVNRPHVVHFIVSDYTYAMQKMWVVAIDMNTKTVESVFKYTNGKEDRGTEAEFLTREKSMCPMPFLACDFSNYIVPQETETPETVECEVEQKPIADESSFEQQGEYEKYGDGYFFPADAYFFPADGSAYEQ